ncbi:BrnT family toxin [Mesorhizobium sp. B1-1-8]|uniref:BrnT family toxin n=1 Tax=Mesorhizobium sp. B1-1-8 TaxID=2589976 RepID=UPI00112676A1|nr:BrnT family toxin [Mesorhizobium sp. B1-1-8]UCI06057.1 BrnT family toxin [Mesorhizobium sp. B1-1-8]
MKIVWDEPKRLANIDKHGLDFAALDEEFFLASTIRAAKAGRFMAIGRVAGGVVAVVFARLGSEGFSMISMRPANQAERRLFDGKT